MESKVLISRKKQIQQLDLLMGNKKSAFLAVYGRRRFGKTFLIREYVSYHFAFPISGLANANTDQQLFNFDTTLRKQSNLVYEAPLNQLVRAILNPGNRR